MFLTSDYGKSWVACNNGLKNTNAGPVKLLNDTLYVGTYGNGVWKQAMDNIELSISGIRDQQTGLKIIPNPASDYFRLDLNENITGNIKVLDLTGRVVLSEKINSTDLVSLEEIPEGIYIVVFMSDQELFTGKLTVKK
ncbi:MAG: T9SS type A sorting domain-containing protein [Bacteroidales bacterium]|nr:T9SS type A sorting domain-containing protein [Bacteroidales bacterium]